MCLPFLTRKVWGEAQGTNSALSREHSKRAIAFLCSEHASYVAGAAWSVDGGTVQVII